MVEEVKHWFGVDTNTMRAWRDNGMLAGQPWGKFWCYTQAELETFVKTYPWAFDNSRMMAGPLRALHAVITRRDPWVRPAELAQMAGCSPETVLRYIRLGRIEAHQRTGHNGAHMVRTSSVPLLQACLAESQHTKTAKMRAWRAAREPQPYSCVFCGCRFMALSQTALVCSKRCRQSRWRLTRTRWGRAA